MESARSYEVLEVGDKMEETVEGNVDISTRCSERVSGELLGKEVDGSLDQVKIGARNYNTVLC